MMQLHIYKHIEIALPTSPESAAKCLFDSTDRFRGFRVRSKCTKFIGEVNGLVFHLDPPPALCIGRNSWRAVIEGVIKATPDGCRIEADMRESKLGSASFVLEIAAIVLSVGSLLCGFLAPQLQQSQRLICIAAAVVMPLGWPLMRKFCRFAASRECFAFEAAFYAIFDKLK
ncbi:MAG: hypothetical protein PHI35_02025 [Victivallaceae bacterium]|nr:hypothetical protein [Victivallaceae bacterium]